MRFREKHLQGMTEGAVCWGQRKQGGGLLQGQRKQGGGLLQGAVPLCGALHREEARPGTVDLRSITGRASVLTMKARKREKGKM